ncbi:PREDICTED: uncharacterized protein LOC104604445 isoform X2 [Nelumbo nucifera]|uniref:Uncharacterized protein LOC104604445 isoform X2 n=1 Tax=Nelumbo nucifera TaxID=4432 RepID=A0A1U8AHR0_NELNU|nr:PREDICTED: uncharacterized protein LOC104604445 isoform X2 [Nelumbo nucifera]
MAIVTGDRYLEYLVKFIEKQTGPLIEGNLVLKLNPVGLHYIQSRLEALQELERLLGAAPVDYFRAYVSDLGDHRALEQLSRILPLVTSLKVVSVFPPPARDPTPLSLLPFGRLKYLELRGCDLSTSAARGLLELRHTLEKLICHNSTDALRHVFASRIKDIKESPVWNRLSFVSCACNGLMLMDESLQLLPAVETLDLSRNRFEKVDNLRKCTKLRHLDLGFNHLRTITSLSEVSCSIVKLVLRNNALTILRGIENLKSVEGLDLSYNIISNFTELEILANLPSLQSLWLEGNPICCARWYRPQVFSFFTNPEKLKLDKKEISKKEAWKRQVILANRKKQPAGFGLYSPAKDDANRERSFNMKKKKLSRLACIEDEEQSCTMKRIEVMKNEFSFLWLRKLKDWIDHNSENAVDNTNFSGQISCPAKENCVKKTKRQNNLRESSRYVIESVLAPEDKSRTNLIESKNSLSHASVDFHAHLPIDSIGQMALKSSVIYNSREAVPPLKIGTMALSQERVSGLPFGVNDSFLPNRLTIQGDDKVDAKANIPLTAIGEIMESHTSSTFPCSPPHYQEDMLHCHHNLEEEFMQISADSHSLASSDSDTSCSEDDFYESGTSLPLTAIDEIMESHTSSTCPCSPPHYQEDMLHRELMQLSAGLYSLASSDSVTSCSEDDFYESGTSLLEVHQSCCLEPLNTMNGSMGYHMHMFLSNDNYYDKKQRELCIRQKDHILLDSSTDKHSHTVGLLEPIDGQQILTDDVLAGVGNAGIDHVMSQETDCLENRKCRSKPKKRVVSLPEENYMTGSADPRCQKLNGNADGCKANMEDGPQNQIFRMKSASLSENDRFIMDYFHAKVADARVSETCLQYMRCDSILELESGCQEREVVILLSSENKLYVLLIDVTSNGSGEISKVIGCHKLEDIKEVVVGMGLQALSVRFERDAPYLLITRSIDKSRGLLCLLEALHPCTSNRYSLKSLEQVQVELFERYICRGSKMSILLYTMLLFRKSSCEDEPWLLRSLFVIEGYMIVCIEDLVQFSSLSLNEASSNSYFSLDSCCSISNITEMIIERWERWSVTLTLDRVTSEKYCCMADPMKEKRMAKLAEDKMASSSCTWKLKWFSEETLSKFMALIKAIYAGTTLSHLPETPGGGTTLAMWPCQNGPWFQR